MAWGEVTCQRMPCHVMPCHVMPCHVMSCHVMSCQYKSSHGTMDPRVSDLEDGIHKGLALHRLPLARVLQPRVAGDRHHRLVVPRSLQRSATSHRQPSRVAHTSLTCRASPPTPRMLLVCRPSARVCAVRVRRETHRLDQHMHRLQVDFDIVLLAQQPARPCGVGVRHLRPAPPHLPASHTPVQRGGRSRAVGRREAQRAAA
jgi:hypothetical protein